MTTTKEIIRLRRRAHLQYCVSDMLPPWEQYWLTICRSSTQPKGERKQYSVGTPSTRNYMSRRWNISKVTNSHYMSKKLISQIALWLTVYSYTVQWEWNVEIVIHYILWKRKLSDKRWVKLNTTQFPISHVMYFEVDDWQKRIAWCR